MEIMQSGQGVESPKKNGRESAPLAKRIYNKYTVLKEGMNSELLGKNNHSVYRVKFQFFFSAVLYTPFK
jgi:hypothetical protein